VTVSALHLLISADGGPPLQAEETLQTADVPAATSLVLTSLDMKAPLCLATELEAGLGSRPICLFRSCCLRAPKSACQIKTFCRLCQPLTAFRREGTLTTALTPHKQSCQHGAVSCLGVVRWAHASALRVPCQQNLNLRGVEP
jgi:hypothetical protein